MSDILHEKIRYRDTIDKFFSRKNHLLVFFCFFFLFLYKNAEIFARAGYGCFCTEFTQF